MCWMTARTGPGALAEAVAAARRQEVRNGHSWGWAAVVDGGLVRERGVGRFPDGPLPESRAAVAHTRYATRGDVTRANAHPFVAEASGRSAALCHNGTWHGADPGGGRSDTREMARLLRGWMRDGLGPRAAFRRLAGRTGQTMLLLVDNGAVLGHRGDFPLSSAPGALATTGLPGSPEPGSFTEVAP